MTFLQRLGYYLGGFSIGLIFLAFFLSGKRTSCDYGPSARVKKNIRTKQLKYSEAFLSSNKIDTSLVNDLLFNGDVNFSESNTKQEPCHIYFIEGKHNEKDVKLKIENCDSIATILDIGFKN